MSTIVTCHELFTILLILVLYILCLLCPPPSHSLSIPVPISSVPHSTPASLYCHPLLLLFIVGDCLVHQSDDHSGEEGGDTVHAVVL